MFEFHFSSQSRDGIFFNFRHASFDFFGGIHDHCSYNIISFILQSDLLLSHYDIRFTFVVFFSDQCLLALHLEEINSFFPGIYDVWLSLLGIWESTDRFLLRGSWVGYRNTVHVVLELNHIQFNQRSRKNNVSIVVSLENCQSWVVQNYSDGSSRRSLKSGQIVSHHLHITFFNHANFFSLRSFRNSKSLDF